MLGRYRKYIKGASLGIRFLLYREKPYGLNCADFPESAFLMFDSRIPQHLGKSILVSEKRLRKLFNSDYKVTLVQVKSLCTELFVEIDEVALNLGKIDSMKKIKQCLDYIFTEIVDKKLSELEIDKI